MSRRDEIQARLDAATPGPWHVIQPDADCESWMVAASNAPPGQFYLLRCLHVCNEGSEQDAALIANAPADLAYLLGEVERLTAGLEEQRQAWQDDAYRREDEWSELARLVVQAHDREERIISGEPCRCPVCKPLRDLLAAQ